jgi:hypothetical protein
MLYILLLFLGLGLGQTHAHTSCEGMEHATTLHNRSMDESTAATRPGYNRSWTPSWTTTSNSWTLMPSMVPDASITASSAARPSSSPMMTQSPKTSLDAIIEIHVGNLSGTASVDLTDGHATSMPLLLENKSMPLPPTATAHFSDPRASLCFGSGECNATKTMPELATAASNQTSTTGVPASGLPPNPIAALEVLSGTGASFGYKNILPFVLLQITAMNLM